MKIKRLSYETKKVCRLGQGWIVFVTPEAKKLGWRNKQMVVSIVKIDGKESILIQKSPIED